LPILPKIVKRRKMIVIGHYGDEEVKVEKIWRDDLGPSDYSGRPEWVMFTDSEYLGTFGSFTRCKKELFRLTDNDEGKYDRDLTRTELSWASFTDPETKKWKKAMQTPGSRVHEESLKELEDGAAIPSGPNNETSTKGNPINLPKILFPNKEL